MPPVKVQHRRATLSKCRGRVPAHGSRVAHLKHPSKGNASIRSNAFKLSTADSSSAGSYAATHATIVLNSTGQLVQVKLAAHARTS